MLIVLIIFITGILFYVFLAALFIAAKLGYASFNVSINREKENKEPAGVQAHRDPTEEVLLQSVLCLVEHCQDTVNCRKCVFWQEESGCKVYAPGDWRVED